MRTLAALSLLALPASRAMAQAAVASDLWRVAQGTLVVPAALSDDGAAPLWTPAVPLAPDQRFRFGIEAIHAPGEIGVAGGIAAFAVRAKGVGVFTFTYGRLGIGGVGYTETSPELVGAAIAIYNQTASIGLTRSFSPALTGGIALRYLSGQLAFAQREQFGFDVGAQYAGIPHLRIGVATRFFDPTFSSSGDAASYSAGAEFRTGSFDAGGARGTLALRYGVTAAPDEGAQHLFSAGIALGTALTLDLGTAREAIASDTVWRTLLGIGIGMGRYVVRIGRDGGVNGFGATYRFGLTAVFK